MPHNTPVPDWRDLQTLWTFECFCQLPSEIRLKIWLLAADEPEPVVICCPTLPELGPQGARVFTQSRLKRRKDNLRAVRRRPVPVMLHICRETRYEFSTRIGEHKAHPTYHLCQGIARNKYRREAKLYAVLDIDIIWPHSTSEICLVIVPLAPCLQNHSVLQPSPQV